MPPKSVPSGRWIITTAPCEDWLNSSQSAEAGEKPYFSWSTGADCTSADVEVRSASYPLVSIRFRSETGESAVVDTPTSRRTAAQSVQESRSASGGAIEVARWRSVRLWLGH